MPDNKRILPQSFGMPLCWILNSAGLPIMLEDNYGNQMNVNQAIEKFTYKYDEENDDECSITIQVAHSSQLDNNEFKVDNKIKVQWGYVLPNGKLIKSAIRTVAIRDKDTTYKAEAIELKLTCTDLVAYLKLTQSNHTTETDNYLEWIKEIASDKYTPTVTVQGKATRMSPFNMTEQRNASIAAGKRGYDKEFIRQSFEVAGKQATQYDKTQLPTIPTNDYVTIKGNGNAVGHELAKRLNYSKEGPAYVEGRDGTLNVLVRNFNQAPYAVYTYAGASGEIIEFKPKTNIVKNDEDEVQSTHVNPETKQVETQNTAMAVTDFGQKDKVEEEDVKNVFNQLKQKWEEAVNNPTNQPTVGKNVTIERSYKPYVAPLLENRSKLKGFYKDFMTNPIRRNIQLKTILNSPIFDQMKREYLVNNYMKKKVERKFEANGKFIGDPSMICGKVYLIKGLAKLDNGSWYATTIEHTIDKSGYIVSGTFLKKPQRIATLMEKRSFIPGEAYGSTAEITPTDIVYNDLPPQSNSSISENDIESRIQSQVAYEENLKEGNDVLFDSKEPINNIPQYHNSANT